MTSNKSPIRPVPPPNGRLKVGNHYIWFDLHAYCDLVFYRDAAMTKEYVPVDDTDPVWAVFGAWFEKHQAVVKKRIEVSKKYLAKKYPPVKASPPPGASL